MTGTPAANNFRASQDSIGDPKMDPEVQFRSRGGRQSRRWVWAAS